MLKTVVISASGLSAHSFVVANVAVHSANAVLACWTSVQLFQLDVFNVVSVQKAKKSGAIDESASLMLCNVLAATMLAVHPLRTEVVAWASCFPYAVACFFLLGCLGAHLRALSSESFALVYHAISWIMLILAIFTKPATISMVRSSLELDASRTSHNYLH